MSPNAQTLQYPVAYRNQFPHEVIMLNRIADLVRFPILRHDFSELTGAHSFVFSPHSASSFFAERVIACYNARQSLESISGAISVCQK
jgi:hypothetical protein